jgi:predicted dehydrogenase
MTAVGVALVGAGPWGLTLGRVVARLPEVDLRWICELDPERRSNAGAIAPAARLTEKLDEALADAAVTAVLVAVDSPRHHAVGLRVLQADRHLLIEKPMALTVADAAELSALADTRGRVLAVGHLLLHHPAVQRARELVAEGVLGKIRWLESARLATGPARPGDSVWWTLAPHDVSLALHLFGAVPRRVTAVGGSGRAPGEETVVRATLQFDDGRLAHIQVARQAAEKKRGFSIVGTDRALTFDELAAAGPLRVHALGSDPARSSSSEVITVGSADALSVQCSRFVADVAGTGASAGNGAHALAVVRVLVAGTRSMRAGSATADVT